MLVESERNGTAGAGGWADGLAGVEVVGADAHGTHLLLDPAVDPMAIMNTASKAGHVVDFGLELPRLSQLFRETVAR